MWNAHCANPLGHFHNLRYYTPPLNARYGAVSNAIEYTFAAQAANYEGIRAFMEGYSRNKHQGATGFVQWMLNNAYPSHIWHLYDYYLTAGGGYYAARKALHAQLHLILTYTNGHVWIVNSQLSSVDAHAANITLHAQVISLSGALLWAAQTSTIGDIGADASLHVADLDVPLASLNAKVGMNTTYLVRLFYTRGSSASMIDVNDYWLSSQMDVMDWEASNWYRTPASAYANFHGLRSLQPLTKSKLLTFVWTYDAQEQHVLITLSLSPAATTIAFFCHVELLRHSVALRPVHLSDNYITLVPGEGRTLVASSISPATAAGLNVTVTCWNDVLGN